MKKIFAQPVLKVVRIQNNIIATSGTFGDGTTNQALSGERRGMDEDYEVY